MISRTARNQLHKIFPFGGHSVVNFGTEMGTKGILLGKRLRSQLKPSYQKMIVIQITEQPELSPRSGISF
jgi:hypothetical protein